MHDCSSGCEDDSSVLCRHRFNFNAETRYYNIPQFQKWPDSKILLHVLDHVRNGIEKGRLPLDVGVVILTKDVDFLKDTQGELGNNVRGNHLEIFDNFVWCQDVTIHVQLLNCKNYGTKGRDNLNCAIYKMNRFFKKSRRP